MRNHETGLKYANTDPSLHFNNVPHRRRGDPTWHGAWIWCLRTGNLDAAHLIRLRNDPDYRLDREEAARAARVQKPLQSCRDMQSEQEESEAA